ncbi:MAG: rod shape-determining protein MreC [Sphaerospermopsis sp. SIO1G2]|nr:rod shape-determining protein MreC [Sphaerospermopsis sp. SIO1G2]
MKIRNSHSAALAVKPRPILQVGGLLMLVMMASLMLMMHHQDRPMVHQLKSSLQSVLLPVTELLSSPAAYMRSFAGNVEEMIGLYYKNQQLEQHNATLLQWQAVAQHLQNENKELRNLLGIKAVADAGYVTATVMSRTHDPLIHTLMVRFDETHKHVEAGLPVLAAEGVIGHVLEVRGQYAEILLITDRQSRIPVKHEASGTRGILVGTNDANALQLHHIEQLGAFQAGDRIVTSDSALFPVNMVVGEVASVAGDAVKIHAYSDARQLHYVTIAVPRERTEMVATQ